MAVAMLLGNSDAGQPVIGPRTAQQLASLGITRVSLLEDPLGIGVILEGWAFDVTRIDDAARALFPGSSGVVRVLREVQHVALVGQTVGRS